MRTILIYINGGHITLEDKDVDPFMEWYTGKTKRKTFVIHGVRFYRKDIIEVILYTSIDETFYRRLEENYANN